MGIVFGQYGRSNLAKVFRRAHGDQRADGGDPWVFGGQGQGQHLGFWRQVRQLADPDHPKEEGDDVLVVGMLRQQRTDLGAQVVMGEALDRRVVEHRTPMGRLRELLTGLAKDIDPGVERQLAGIATLEENLRRHTQRPRQDPVVEQTQPGKDRPGRRHDHVQPILLLEEQSLDPHPRGLVDDLALQPLRGQELADGAVVKPHGPVDAFIENGPREQGTNVGVVPIGQDLLHRQALGVGRAVGDPQAGLLGQGGRGGDQPGALANLLHRDRSGVGAVLIDFFKPPIDAGLHQLQP